MAQIESKVTAATLATFVVGLAAAVLNAVQADSSLLGPLPAWLQAPVLALVPAGLAFLAGYQARHTPRGMYGSRE
ncbi:holin [Streptomyces sp. NPDC050421]|uniref:holin n=1 Tax=Streptomyces sp. NPDC050421 TaxID=3365613 RepID=UPI0037AAEF50